jgi:hypothetical protein
VQAQVLVVVVLLGRGLALHRGLVCQCRVLTQQRLLVIQDYCSLMVLVHLAALPLLAQAGVVGLMFVEVFLRGQAGAMAALSPAGLLVEVAVVGLLAVLVVSAVLSLNGSPYKEQT